MASVKYKGRWYEESSLSDKIKKELGILEDDFDEEKILKELEETPISVKKNHVKKRKKGNNISTGNIIIGSPSLNENEQKGGK